MSIIFVVFYVIKLKIGHFDLAGISVSDLEEIFTEFITRKTNAEIEGGRLYYFLVLRESRLTPASFAW